MISTATQPNIPNYGPTPKRFDGWNGLLWNDYLNCDSSAAEAILQAERDELAYIDAQCAKALENAYPIESTEEQKGFSITVVPLLQEDSKSETTENQSITTPNEERSPSPIPQNVKTSKPICNCDEPALAEYCAGDGWVQDTPSSPLSITIPKTPQKKHQRCHCRKHSLQLEPQSPTEQIRLNLHPRRKSLERHHTPQQIDLW
ncbi:hypothetical protein NA57DRAFT_75913 [Rhizodiscina lignyota]|uniref:Uncharacterized protein n=1 Tax=Rhizodiscina lignyota TaxID=1504668 RepID=A0A9P4IB72_9PEZI|nr:hypothetical protein NA57DRAFT_75913 [Rhizodiscina lignyota]